MANNPSRLFPLNKKCWLMALVTSFQSFLRFFKNSHCYIAEFIMVQKLKRKNSAGDTRFRLTKISRAMQTILETYTLKLNNLYTF